RRDHHDVVINGESSTHIHASEIHSLNRTKESSCNSFDVRLLSNLEFDLELRGRKRDELPVMPDSEHPTELGCSINSPERDWMTVFSGRKKDGRCASRNPNERQKAIEVIGFPQVGRRCPTKTNFLEILILRIVFLRR
ncbi:MAG: hypothetical protein ACRDF4_04820, partial [Rhabdochlamydiaceae bacterium]